MTLNTQTQRSKRVGDTQVAKYRSTMNTVAAHGARAAAQAAMQAVKYRLKAKT